jgi:hypothetical protein
MQVEMLPAALPNQELTKRFRDLGRSMERIRARSKVTV